jgi:hypothetical protein
MHFVLRSNLRTYDSKFCKKARTRHGDINPYTLGLEVLNLTFIIVLDLKAQMV